MLDFRLRASLRSQTGLRRRGVAIPATLGTQYNPELFSDRQERLNLQKSLRPSPWKHPKKGKRHWRFPQCSSESLLPKRCPQLNLAGILNRKMRISYAIVLFRRHDAKWIFGDGISSEIMQKVKSVLSKSCPCVNSRTSGNHL